MIVTEGLTQLFNYVVVRGDFVGYSVREGLSIDLVQFMDDALILGSGCWKNLWSIKSILRGFELFSGLGVNFYKSRLISINVSKHFLLDASNFLACKVEDSSFIFLGLPVGCNPRRLKVWTMIVEKFKSKLVFWK